MYSLGWIGLLLLHAPLDADTVRAARSRSPSDTAVTRAADSTVRVDLGGFVDAYVAFDRGRPRSLDRSYTTQAARHGEFNINLAYVDLTVSAPRVRGRLALQAGTSVQSNYDGEPRIGRVSGPELGRLLQEAYAGFELRPGLWIDGGVFYANVGMEGWVSRDNPIYTRSLVADYSPYYSAGVRATWQATARLTARIDVVNGWQIISENNEDKTFGVRLDYAASPVTTLSWYALAGREPSGPRLFNGVGLRSRLGSRFDVMAQVDAGRQSPSAGDGTARSWYGGMLIGRWSATPSLAITGRVERYDDPDQVLVRTTTPDGLRATGASIGFERQSGTHLTWRNEARLLTSRARVFPDRATPDGLSRHNLVIVSALALSF